MARSYDAEAVERKWLARWEAAGLYRAQRPEDPSAPKFFIHFAYPGISGYLHVGHMRGFTYADVLARHKRMTGHCVYFPAGFHASGIPSVGLARRVARGDQETLAYLRANGCPEDVIPSLAEPEGVVRYFSRVYAKDYWRRFGFLIDGRTLCTTIDPGYARFIQWQFRRLNDQGLLVQKPHHGPFCPVDGAVAVDPSETDISRGGQAEVKEFTLVPFEGPDGVVLPCATLRPETVYGVTNLWLDPEGEYVRIRVGGAAWIVGRPAAAKLRNQREDVAPEEEPVEATTVLAWRVKNPLTGQELPVLAAPFVDPAIATGVVMSVPAHAPYDWQALKDLGMPVEPRVIIQTPGSEGVPAEAACRSHRVKDQADVAALEAATDEVYGTEFAKGVMVSGLPDVGGLPVRQAKEAVKANLAAGSGSGPLYEFSQPVVCRCGQDVVIRRIPDQWFIKYSDPDLTARSKAHAATMRIHPNEYGRDMPHVLDWFGDRACIRRGSWLGTPFPFDEEWIIEPISDSTLYSAYYVVTPHLAEGRLKEEELSDAFFDHVFLGKGKAVSAVWETVRKDFLYWYPVDVNLGGKEHKTVHFPPYVMNHVALLGDELSPRGIFVNWWVTQQAGQKISKSKGGAEPIPGAAQRYTVDGMRLYYCNVASAHVDIEWDPDVVMANRARVERIHAFVTDLLEEAEEPGDAQGIDRWLADTWSQRLAAATVAFEAFDLRQATTELFYEFYNDLQWFRRRGGRLTPTVRRVLEGWVAALTPVTPFLAEELWQRLGGDGLVSGAAFPTVAREAAADDVSAREAYLRRVLEDLVTVRRIAKVESPRQAVLFTAPAWKRRLVDLVHDAVRATTGRPDVGVLIKQALADPEFTPHAQHVAALVTRTVKEASRQPKASAAPELEEDAVLAAAAPFLSQELGGVPVAVHRADDPEAPDPAGKRHAAQPGKPAIYLA